VQYTRLLRLGQWTKNLLVFAAFLFTGSFANREALYLTVAAFLAMSLVGSAAYVFNDILDAGRDRLHPTKKSRPIASGAASPYLSSLLGVGCLALGFVLGASIGVNALWVLVAYVALQVVYNLGGKRVPVADVFIVSLGFVLRAVLGAVAISVSISGWLLFCTFALALLLGLGKRRNEFVLLGEDRGASRASLSGYTKQALDALVLVAACSSTLFYGVYAIESKTARAHPALIVTALFVFYGVARYVFLVFTRDEGGEPDVLLVKDVHILLSVILFVVSVYLAFKGVQIPFLEGASR
jgi:4-hydroxybenzoate polyprenyltransferase